MNMGNSKRHCWGWIGSGDHIDSQASQFTILFGPLTLAHMDRESLHLYVCNFLLVSVVACLSGLLCTLCLLDVEYQTGPKGVCPNGLIIRLVDL